MSVAIQRHHTMQSQIGKEKQNCNSLYNIKQRNRKRTDFSAIMAQPSCHSFVHSYLTHCVCLFQKKPTTSFHSPQLLPLSKGKAQTKLCTIPCIYQFILRLPALLSRHIRCQTNKSMDFFSKPIVLSIGWQPTTREAHCFTRPMAKYIEQSSSSPLLLQRHYRPSPSHIFHRGSLVKPNKELYSNNFGQWPHLLEWCTLLHYLRIFLRTSYQLLNFQLRAHYKCLTIVTHF